ncbi:MAG TPA: diadenylate cyclase CdaA [Syntrophomonas sp.]|nr:diadenylate cyclase CdaA [Syntrophomonas sp.]HRW12445.1 diadenylate cyclase CdaA [Syntrophomonas sp.]
MDPSLLSGVSASPWNIFRNLLDILIVAYIIYRLLGLIRETRAEKLLKGLIILLLFSVVVSILDLHMLNWLLDKLWIIFAITLPIVFQPELRRFLEQLGQGSFFKSSHGNQDAQSYQAIIAAITEATSILSRDKTGALMILARQTGIAEYTESGISLDALVTAGLLVNIFVPNTPLHDGAVVIKEGRLSKATCVLPLSENTELPGDLGTRHRAGLGITEVSDAIAVIVSEETGKISMAIDGRLYRPLQPQYLQEMLTRELLAAPEKQGLWRRWLSR